MSVHAELNRAQSVAKRLALLESKIYEVGAKVFGVSKRQQSKKPSFVNRRGKRCARLVEKKNALLSSVEECTCQEERAGFQFLLKETRGKIRVLRKAERRLRRKREWKRCNGKFLTNPYEAGKRILDPHPQVFLTVEKETLDSHRASTLADELRDLPLGELDGLPEVQPTKMAFPAGPFRFGEFLALLKTRRNGSAPGVNMVPYKVYKNCEHLAHFLFSILSACLGSQQVPVQWRIARIFFATKTAEPDPTRIGDFREIAISNVEGKLFFSMVSRRLSRHIILNNKFVNLSVQKGCMERVPGCWEHMSMVWKSLNEARENKGDIANVWLDIANAYGSIPHQLIFLALRRYGVPEKWISIVTNYYQGLWSRSFSESAPSSWQEHKRGIFAGCTLSIVLFVAAMNIVLEFVLASNIKGPSSAGGVSLPPVRAFMDDLNLMAPSVADADTLLKRACVALKWARMEFRPDKSRSLVIKGGRSMSVTPFSICTNAGISGTIPSIQSKPVKFLGRIINGHLSDRKSIVELSEKLESGLKAINKSKLSGVRKVWILSNLLVPRIRWPLMIYEVSISCAIKLEQRISVYLRRWLNLSNRITDLAIYSKISPCPIPLVRLSSVLKASKISGYLQLRDSKDPLVSATLPAKNTRSWEVATAAKSADSALLFRDMFGSPHIGKRGLGFEKVPPVAPKGSKQHRDQVRDVERARNDESDLVSAVSKAVQCHWTRWVNYIQNDLSWSKALSMPPNLLSFCLQSTYDTLPSPANLS